jgi:hypothetical protein
VRAIETWAQAREEGGGPGGVERVVVIRTVGSGPDVWYALSNARRDVGLAEVVRAQRRRHGVEEALAVGKGEVGLGHYEVRGWVGWHHHMTLTLLAGWFLALERDRVVSYDCCRLCDLLFAPSKVGKVSHSRSGQMWSASPAAIAGVRCR